MSSKELDLLGPRVRFLTELGPSGEDFCVFIGIIPPGLTVPLHSHADREVFVIQEGTLDIYIASRWSAHTAGETIEIASDAKHALMNKGQIPVTVITITTSRLARFFGEVGRPLDTLQPGPPTPKAVAHFIKTAHNYGYWLASPEENAAIGVLQGPSPELST